MSYRNGMEPKFKEKFLKTHVELAINATKNTVLEQSLKEIRGGSKNAQHCIIQGNLLQIISFY